MTRDAQKLRIQAERGRQAEELMRHPLLIEAFDNLNKEIETGWKNSSGGDREAREEAYRLHRSALRLRGILKQFMVSGSNAKLLLEAEESKAGAGADS